MKIQLTCDYCGSIFERENRENNRSQKLGRKNFCSRKCMGKANINNLPLEKGTIDISLFSSNRKDKFTGLREFVRRANNRKHESCITKEELLEIWEDQKGICPYSGIQMIKPSYKNKNCPILTASLDRIDSSKGYVKDNVQFISTAMNYMKGQMSHEEMISLCKIIAEYWK